MYVCEFSLNLSDWWSIVSWWFRIQRQTVIQNSWFTSVAWDRSKPGANHCASGPSTQTNGIGNMEFFGVMDAIVCIQKVWVLRFSVWFDVWVWVWLFDCQILLYLNFTSVMSLASTINFSFQPHSVLQWREVVWFFYWLWLWLCHSRATHSILVIMNRSEAVDNAQFHIVILVADGALSNVLIKKYEALLPQLQLHFQWASYIEPENLLHTSIMNHHTVSYSIHMYT